MHIPLLYLHFVDGVKFTVHSLVLHPQLEAEAGCDFHPPAVTCLANLHSTITLPMPLYIAADLFDAVLNHFRCNDATNSTLHGIHARPKW